MFDWIKNVFGGNKTPATIRIFKDKNGKARVQILDSRPPEVMIRRVLFITSASSFKSVEEARAVAKYIADGGVISDETQSVNWHD